MKTYEPDIIRIFNIAIPLYGVSYHIQRWAIGMVLIFAGGAAPAQDCPSQKYKRSSQTPIVKDMVNPHPSEDDFELPMPCGGKLFLRHVCIPARSFLDDFQFNMGCEECRRKDEGFMETKRTAAVAGAFTLEELPESWRAKLIELARREMAYARLPMTKTQRPYIILSENMRFQIGSGKPSWLTIARDGTRPLPLKIRGRRRIFRGLRRWSLPDVIRNGC